MQKYNDHDQVSVLEVWEEANRLVFRILEPAEFLDPARPVVTESAVKVSASTISGLSRRLERLSQVNGEVGEDVRDCGRALYNQLVGALDADLRTRLADLRSPLLVSTRESDIIWELLHDGEDYWGMKYSFARQIRSGVRPPSIPLKKSPSSCLIVANPSDEKELQSSEKQAQSLIKRLQKLGVKCRYLSRSQATSDAILSALSSGNYDIFHYTGHVVRETGQEDSRESSEYALKLYDGRLRSFEIEKAVQGISVAFINGCQSALSVESLTNAFLRRGATLVIGTVFKVSAFGALVFAEKFYERALRGEPVGSAFQAARKTVYQDSKCGNAWMSFVMYGNPSLKIIGETLPKALQKSYDEGARRVIENCVKISEATGAVCSPFLFAALLGGDDPTLRELLHANGISTQDLKQIFENAEENDRNVKESGESLVVSENVIEIVRLSEDEARGDGRDFISEKDLLIGFARQGGGSMGKLLLAAGIRLDEIIKQGESIERDSDCKKKSETVRDSSPDELNGWGSLSRNECTEKAWQIIEQTVGTACSAGTNAGTPHLFLAFLKNPPDELTRFIKQHRIPMADLERLFMKVLGVKNTPVIQMADCKATPNLGKVMRLAKTATKENNHEKITDSDLMQGFVHLGGGGIGEVLEDKFGMELSVMYSGLFNLQGSVTDNKLDQSIKRVLSKAASYASQMGWESLNTPHLLLGLLSIKDGSFVQSLTQKGLDPTEVKENLIRSFTMGDPQKAREIEINLLNMSTRFRRILTGAEKQALKDGCECIGERQILLSLGCDGGGVTAQALKSMGIDLRQLGTTFQNEKGEQTGASKTPTLDKLGRDLTAEARAGRLRPLIGRDKEIERLQTILLRPGKNTPVLVGEAGVGKTAVVEGLAQRIADGSVAAPLQGARLIEIPVNSMVAGTTYRGDFESRMGQMIKEASQNNVIIFIDELHTIVGAGAAGSKALDAGNILKPYLARGEVRCIGATTFEDYRRFIEPDSALTRRFQVVMVSEPTPEDSVVILEGLRGRYETELKLKITDEALRSAVKLSVQYFPDRRLPDKAIDLLEEACAAASIHPGEGETVVDVPEINRAISQILPGLKVGVIETGEQIRLLGIEETLKKRVIGQDEAVASVARAVRITRTNLRDSSRPAGVFLFAGPSGVGKTFLAQELASELFGQEDAFIRIDMTEFSERHTVSGLLGAPPGYVGYQEEGRLGVLRRRPRSLVLLDEIDKAHPDVLNIFLQIFDGGRVTDAQGHVIDVSQAIFVMTANFSPDQAFTVIGFDMGENDNLHVSQEKQIGQLRERFKAEFLNRVDAIIIFNPLKKEELREISKHHIQELIKKVSSEHGLIVNYEESVLDYLARECDSTKGAREVPQKIDNLIRAPLSSLIISGVSGSLSITADSNGIQFSVYKENAGE